MKNDLILKYYRMHEDSQVLKFHTSGAACFDVSAYLKLGVEVKYFSDENIEGKYILKEGILDIYPGFRVMIPTGIILDIPSGYSVRTHPRSGTGWKFGLSHPHDEGIVDHDYFHELFLVFINNTKSVVTIEDGQRLVQAELIKTLDYNIEETDIRPSQKTERNGGFGSTGK